MGLGVGFMGHDHGSFADVDFPPVLFSFFFLFPLRFCILAFSVVKAWWNENYILSQCSRGSDHPQQVLCDTVYVLCNFDAPCLSIHLYTTKRYRKDYYVILEMYTFPHESIASGSSHLPQPCRFSYFGIGLTRTLFVSQVHFTAY